MNRVARVAVAAARGIAAHLAASLALGLAAGVAIASGATPFGRAPSGAAEFALEALVLGLWASAGLAFWSAPAVAVARGALAAAGRRGPAAFALAGLAAAVATAALLAALASDRLLGRLVQFDAADGMAVVAGLAAGPAAGLVFRETERRLGARLDRRGGEGPG